MGLRLSREEQAMLEGERGEAVRLAMSVVARMAEVCGAEELMPIEQAHIDACTVFTPSALEFVERLVALGGKVAVPTTLNASPLDATNWHRLGVGEDYAASASRFMDAYLALGCIPTWTCAPYQGYLAPRFGQQVAWGESNAVVYANSVLGARTNRYGDFMDICAALTGRVPRWGLHLDRNRRATVVVEVSGQVVGDPAFYPLLGHALGLRVGDAVPAIVGLPGTATTDDLKALGAAAASSGAVAMFHAVGITPEAPSLEAALGGNTPSRTITIGPEEIDAARRDLNTLGEGEPLDAVVLGCPHLSFEEFRRLAQAIEAHDHDSAHTRVPFFVFTSRQSHALVAASGLADVLEGFGVQVVLDTCPFQCRVVPAGVSAVMTNSGKCGYYAPAELGVKVALGGIGECVKSAIEGKVARER